MHYDVRPLVERASEFPGPDLQPPGDHHSAPATGGSGGFSCFHDPEWDDSNHLEPDQLEELVCDAVGEDEWDDPTTIQIRGGWLIVDQYPWHHAKIRRLLTMLRGELQRAVQIECGVYELPAELAARLRGAGAGVLEPAQAAALDAAVAAGDARLGQATVLHGRDGQRISVSSTRQRAYLGDVERSSGGTGQVVEEVPDPIIEVLETGVAVEARASCTPTRTVLELRWTRATLLDVSHQESFEGTQLEQPRVDREVVEGQVTLGSRAGRRAQGRDRRRPRALVGRRARRAN